jgi:RHS repeat-associated protein
VNNGATTAYYTYNGNGQRVKKSVSGSTTIFHYSLSGQIIAESNSAGSITAEYVYLNGQLLAKIEGANTYYYHNDHLGTPQKLTDSTGTVVWSADYKPFGEATITVSTITNNLRFPGQYFDAETGLNYNYFRDYNPAIGRYVESDRMNLGSLTITLRDGNQEFINYLKENPHALNLFAYVENNPLSRIDPNGQSGYLIASVVITGLMLVAMEAQYIMEIYRPRPIQNVNPQCTSCHGQCELPAPRVGSGPRNFPPYSAPPPPPPAPAVR